MNILNIKFSLSPSNFSIPRNLYELMLSLQTPRSTRSSSVDTLVRPPTRSSLKITGRSFRYASPHLWHQLPHSLRQPRLAIPDSSFLHDHLTSRMTIFLSNPTLHRYLAPIRTDFMDICTALRLFLHFSFFLVFFLPFFQLPFKHFSFFSLCARLNWQFACQFFSGNHLSYRIVSYRTEERIIL